MSTPSSPLHVRWLGRVPYSEALAVQQAVFEHGVDQHLLLVEHQHVFTYGQNANLEQNLKCDPAQVGAELVAVHRGGDITYHGPGQLVGYPIVRLQKPTELVGFVREIEAALIRVCEDLGIPALRVDGRSGVWIRDAKGDRKIAAIGIRVAKGVSMHGFALNVNPDLAAFAQIVPCLEAISTKTTSFCGLEKSTRNTAMS